MCSVVDGGLAYTESNIGIIQAVGGSGMMAVQIFGYPRVDRWIGSLSVFRWSLIFWLAIAALPFSSLLADERVRIGRLSSPFPLPPSFSHLHCCPFTQAPLVSPSLCFPFRLAMANHANNPYFVWICWFRYVWFGFVGFRYVWFRLFARRFSFWFGA